MKKIIAFIIALAVIVGGNAHAASRVELGLHKPSAIAEFSDGFDGDLELWSVEVANGSDWHIMTDAEEKSLTSGAVDTWNAEQETIIVSTAEILSDKYSVTFDATDKRYGAMASLVFKYTSPQHFYSLRMLNIDDVDYIGFYRRNGVTLWQEENLTLVQFPGGIRTPGKTFKITVEVDSGNFKGYVDGALVTEYTEDRKYFDGNRAGIFQSYGDPSYDNFEIYINDSAYLGDEEFLYNRQLLKDLGFLDGFLSSFKGDALLTNEMFNQFMTKLCLTPVNNSDVEYADLNEVVDAFLKALGYSDIPSTSAYHSAKTELLKGVSASDNNITVKDFAQMAVNSFDIDVVQQIYGSTEKYVVDDENRLLNIYHNIRFDEAVLSDNGRTALDGKSKMKKGQVGFDNGFVADAGTTDAGHYIGYSMKYYYDNADTPKLLHVRINTSDGMFLYSDEILSYTNGTLTYSLRENDKLKKEKIPTTAHFIYNGMAVSAASDYMFTPDSGSITLIDNDGSTDVDVVIITDYRDVVVENADATESKIFDKLSTVAVGWSGAKYVDFYNSSYRSVGATDIYAKDVVSVAKSADGKYFTFMISRSTVNGKIDSIDYNKNAVVINGAEYYLSNDFMDSSFISAGDTGVMYLNIDGRGVYFEHDTETAFTVAYLINMQQTDSMDNRVKLQLFDGEVKVIPCAATIKINDRVYKNNTLYNAIQSYRGVFDIFEYKLNSKGEISYIVFPQDDAERNDSRLSEIGRYSGGAYYKSDTRSFSGLLLADAKAKVFLVPLDRSRVDAYALTDVSYFRNDIMYYFLVGYSRGDNNETAEYIVSEFNDTPTYLVKDVCILTGITDVLTDDGHSAKQISVLYNGVEARDVVVGEDCSLNGAVPGDLIQYSTDLDGRVHEIRRVFDSTDKVILSYGYGDYTSSCRMVYGTMSDVRKSSFIFENTGGGTEIVTLGCPIVIYDSTARGEKVRLASTADIKDYISYGNDADKAVIRFEYGVPREIVIYR